MSHNSISFLHFDLRDVLPRHDHKPYKTLLHVDFDVSTLARFLVPFGGKLDVCGRRLPVLVRHGEDDVALGVGALHLSGKHAAVGGVQVESAVEQG